MYALLEMRLVNRRLGLLSYDAASAQQHRLVTAALAHKAASSTLIDAAPSPTVLTMQLEPTYTTGRRERGLMPLEVRQLLEQEGAVVRETRRGGQTTFHGPGQLVAYPIIDLLSFSLTPRCYVHLLEQVLIDTCLTFGVVAKRTEHTGVWVDETHKIAAIGIHLRRNITSHGIALNTNTNLAWYDKIVACGLPHVRATSLHDQGKRQVTLIQVEQEFVRNLATALNLDTVTITEDHESRIKL